MKVSELNEERKRQKLSVEELAQKAQLPKGTIEKVLFGIVQNPRIDTMRAIERALGLSDNAWTDEDYENGVINTKKVSITPDEEDILIKFREVNNLIGEKSKDLIIDFCNVLMEKFKK